MGADNWAICPQCRVAAIKARQKLIVKADKAYGVKPATDYLALRTEAEKPLALEQTLREDYGLGVGVDGEFGVNYKARCTSCQFAFEFSDSKVALAVPEEYRYEADGDDPYGYNFRK